MSCPVTKSVCPKCSFRFYFVPNESDNLKTPIYTKLSNPSESSLTQKINNQSLIWIVTILFYLRPTEYSLILDAGNASILSEIESLFGHFNMHGNRHSSVIKELN